jgi:hypothetical protein
MAVSVMVHTNCLQIFYIKTELHREFETIWSINQYVNNQLLFSCHFVTNALRAGNDRIVQCSIVFLGCYIYSAYTSRTHSGKRFLASCSS